MLTSRRLPYLGVFIISGAALAACGGAGGDGNTSGNTTDGFGGSGSTSSTATHNAPSSSSGLGGSKPPADLMSISISPADATIDVDSGATATKDFHVIGHMTDGSMRDITSGLTWSTDSPQVGGIDTLGSFTASGSVGGVVKIAASYANQDASANLTVKLHVTSDPGAVKAMIKTQLEGATAADANVTWAYPYDGTLFPRGLLAPLLMWNGGAPSDTYLVTLSNDTFELSAFLTAPTAPTAQVPLDETIWQQFVDSSSGKTKFKVARWDGVTATVVADHTWSVAPQSMRGTIYYWSNDLGRVLRIKPGSPTPDDFANHAPLNDPASYTQSSCLMTCHTVSANGSTLVSGGGVFGGSYNLVNDTTTTSLGGTWGPVGGGASSSSVVRWMNAALSPTGKYIMTNAQAEALAYANDGVTQGFLGLYTTADGQPVPTSGLMGVPLTEPAWSPEGSRIAYVDAGSSITTPWYVSWNIPPAGDLKVFDFDETANPMVSAPTTVVATGADPNQRISWPTMTPDGKWIVYQRGPSADTRYGNGDLYIASATTPNVEIRLAALNGDGYPFAAGARDVSWNYEPSFAPVAAGGYFWVVLTSRRTYGNKLTGDTTSVKQLWVAAIDQSPQPGVDPSHPPFHLTGQDENKLAMRGFWALEPCKQDGQGCGSGTECCGGFCDDPAGGGEPVCGSQSHGCSKDGDHCDTAGDCCDAGSGTKCINHVCSVDMPH